MYCSGFTWEKACGIREVLGQEHWDRLALARAEQGWLLSHAGFHPALLETPTVTNILEQSERAMTRARRGKADPLLGAGRDRGGDQAVGGALWMDWATLVPLAGISQIVGHTPGDTTREKAGLDSRNICLDVGNASVAGMLEDGKFYLLKRKEMDV